MKGGMNELALFAGAGGGLLASHLLGWNTIGAVEIEKYPREVLLQRQRDGVLDHFPIWDDVRTFDGKPWRGLVDVVSGGFPCQDISVAGAGMGLAGSRSGLWFEYLRIVEEVRPQYVFAENSPNLRTHGLGTIITGLTGLGYDIRWGVLGAWHVGANHKRNRMWILARNSNCNNVKQIGGVCKRATTNTCGVRQGVANSNGPRCEEQRWPITSGSEHTAAQRISWWEVEPQVGRVVDGFPGRVGELTALGNAQVPIVAATAWNILRGSI